MNQSKTIEDLMELIEDLEKSVDTYKEEVYKRIEALKIKLNNKKINRKKYK